MRMDDLKKVIAKLIRENFHQSISESVNEMSKNDVHFKEIMKMYDKGGSFTKKKVAVVVCNNPKASRHDIEEELLDSDYNQITQYQDELHIDETLVKEVSGRIPKLFLKIEAVKKEINRLTAERKSKFGGEYARKLNAETDTNKREKLKEPILAISKKITKLQENLLDLYEMEEKYIQNLDKDAELEFESVQGDKIQNLNNRIKALKDKISATKNSEQKSKFQNTLKNALQSLSNIRKAQTESINEAKFEVYHDSYTSAINAAREWAEKQGYTINDDDAFTKIGMGPRKPSEGKTNKFSIELSKDDKVQRKQLHIQVYGMRTKYELNCYIG